MPGGSPDLDGNITTSAVLSERYPHMGEVFARHEAQGGLWVVVSGLLGACLRRSDNDWCWTIIEPDYMTPEDIQAVLDHSYAAPPHGA